MSLVSCLTWKQAIITLNKGSRTKMHTVISSRLPAGNVLIFHQAVVGAGHGTVQAMR